MSRMVVSFVVMNIMTVRVLKALTLECRGSQSKGQDFFVVV
jgi:hypothetical protein